MKKLLLFAFVAASVSANAQYTVWEDDFNDGEITDWTVWDLNADNISWQANRDLQVDDAGLPDITVGTHKVMGVYSLDMATGGQLGNGNGYDWDHEWVRSPAIDLSLFGGTTQLVINAQMMIYDATSSLYVYVSTSPEQDSFVLHETVSIIREPMGSIDEQFNDYIVDISEYAGEEQLYFALVTDQFGLYLGHEIDNVKVTAEEIVAGTKDQARVASKIKQNPVNDMLQLQLGTSVTAENVKLQIYNVAGMLVKETAYNEAGISVSDLAGGMYLLQLSDGAATERMKFIKR
jgi:Secretion system C-terminal sorting domain